MAQPQPLIKETSRSCMAKLGMSRVICACGGPVPERHHPFASIGTSHLENSQRNLELVEVDGKAQCFGEGYLMLEPSAAIWVHFLLFTSLLMQPWAGPCTRCPLFPPAACDQDCLSATGLETSQGPMDQLHEGPSSSPQQPGAAAGRQSIPAELGWEL